ncbi:uncharacterized protein LOC130997590 [Salvia miltiorrhiza]|uniref:uncharacterized protein LOC130997590 n=1 Tax=Salvia miltiorrhiza TaxID=226208 RepID=UPI0025AB7E62|nr:uncharacterized protein LOC130997590 [Salvia miltiorrhiza]
MAGIVVDGRALPRREEPPFVSLRRCFRRVAGKDKSLPLFPVSLSLFFIFTEALTISLSTLFSLVLAGQGLAAVPPPPSPTVSSPRLLSPLSPFSDIHRRQRHKNPQIPVTRTKAKLGFY